MRRAIGIIGLLFALALLPACDWPTIFSREDSQQQPVHDADPWLTLRVTGGFAGVNQKLIVRRSGIVSFAEDYPWGVMRTIALSADETEGLRTLILANRFFGLDSAYTEPEVDDAFLYTIRVVDNGRSKTVVTHNHHVPENLRRIVEALLELKQRVSENGLDFILELSRDTLSVGDSLVMRLSVTNVSDEALRLNFPSGQTFDFAVLDLEGAGTEEVIWNWAYGRFFTQALRSVEFPASATERYEVVWDGRDNRGKSVQGRFVVRGELVSTPGGGANGKRVVITAND